MVVIKVFSECIKINYKSTLLSKASFLSLTISLLSFLLPYFIALQTKGTYKKSFGIILFTYFSGFWINKIMFHEQPNINLRGEYLLVALTNNHSHPIICSSIIFYKEHMNELDNCVIFTVKS